MSGSKDEAVKLQKHLSLLRQEYSKLQQRYVELEHAYGILSGQTGSGDKDSFPSRLVKSVADLHENSLFSDITIRIGSKEIPGHRVVLLARGTHSWCKEGNQTLSSLTELELTGLREEVGLALMKWVYTDKINLSQPPAGAQPGAYTCVSFSVDLLAAAHKYSLPDLKLQCERFLIGNVDTVNCISLYQTSEEYLAPQLSQHCLEVITTHWEDFSTEDFLPLTANLLYQMFKKRSEYPLHLAIEHRRDDVVFLYLIEFSKGLTSFLAQRDQNGILPLHMSLVLRNESIAETLIQHGSRVDQLDSSGSSLLHLAVTAGDLFTANMLISKGAQTDLNTQDRSTVLHLAAAYSLAGLASAQLDPVYKKFTTYRKAQSLAPLVTKLLAHGANPNSQDINGDTPLHIAIKTANYEIIDLLLDAPGVDLQSRNAKNETLLWLALTHTSQGDSVQDLMIFEPQENVVANKLVKKGCDVNAMFPDTEDMLLHVAAQEERETAALFLLHHGAHTSVFNKQGLAPLHIAANKGLVKLTAALLEKSANPNLITKEPATALEAYVQPTPFPHLIDPATPCDVFSDLVTSYLDHIFDKMAPSSPRFKSLPKSASLSSPVFDSKFPGRSNPSPIEETESYNPFGVASPSSMQTPISLDKIVALGTGSELNPFPDEEDLPTLTATAPSLEKDLNPFDSSIDEEHTPLQSPPIASKQIIIPIDPIQLYTEARQEHELKELTPGRTALHISIAARSPQVTAALLAYHQEHRLAISAQLPLDINVVDGNSDSPLALALWTHQLDVAEKLVQVGSDLQGRVSGKEMSLLLRTISCENSDAAHFLIRALSLRDSSLLEGDLSLSAAVKHRLPGVVQRLVQAGLNVNTPDKRGDPPLWVSLRSKQDDIASLLITSDDCDRDFWRVDPGLGLKYSLLHRAILLKDAHTACYLVRAGASIDAPVSSHQPTSPSRSELDSRAQQILGSPMHLSSTLGLDEVVQVLFENQANVNSVDRVGRSPLHLAIKCKQSICIKLLLAHPALDLSIRDASGNTPFSTALRAKDHSAASAILDRDPHSANTPDQKGRSYIHIAVEEEDLFMLAFLIKVQVDVNSRVRNQMKETPLHLAIKTENETVIRHLLDGANVNLVDGRRQTPLHLAVSRNLPHIVEALLEHAASINIQDEKGNNALHVAMEKACQASASILLGHDSCDLSATNSLGQHYLHVLASNAPKGEVSANIYRCLIEIAGKDAVPLNALDAEGNTALLLAFCNGNMHLCEALIKDGAHPSIPNRKGLSIFTVPTPSIRPLHQVISMIRREPDWLDAPTCLNHECQTKFTFSVRKHHCRHCGRILCTKCLSQQIAIFKFDINKPVKVCDMCCEVLSKGMSLSAHH